MQSIANGLRWSPPEHVDLGDWVKRLWRLGRRANLRARFTDISVCWLSSVNARIFSVVSNFGISRENNFVSDRNFGIEYLDLAWQLREQCLR